MMRRLALALALLLGLSPALGQQSVIVQATTASIPITGTIAAATVIVTGLPGRSIYVTALGLIPVATSVVTFTQGTGARLRHWHVQRDRGDDVCGWSNPDAR